AKSLHTKVLIELGLEERSEYVHNPLRKVEEFPANSEQAFPDGTTAADIFEDIGAGRTLLILGEPGSGKTVTLLKLAESLIARTENDLSQPLPVVVNLSSWAKQRKSIAEWLVQELYEIYGASKSLGKAWVDQEQLILLLDGLDEVDAKYRKDCVQALNQFIQEHGLTEMIVCSRIRDYQALSERLKLCSAICVQPLTSKQIDQFLEQVGESLAALKIALQQNRAELQSFASSPLILSIMSLAYQDYHAELLFTGASEDQHKQLFDTYIERMFMRRGTTQAYSREHTLCWLAWLAKRMMNASQTVFLIERLQPSWLPSKFNRVIYRLATVLIFGLAFGLLFGLIGGLNIGRSYFDPIYGGHIGLISGLILGAIMGNSGDIKTVEMLKWSWPEAKISFHKGLIGGLIIGAILGPILGQIVYSPVLEQISGIALGQRHGLILGLISGLSSGLLFGQAVGLIGGFRGPEIQKSNISNQGIWKSAKNALIVELIIGLSIILTWILSDGIIFALLFAPISWIIYGITGWVDVLSSGLIVTMLGGLICGGSACLRHFTLRLILYYQGNIPWNYSRFLDYATDRLFMQKVGGGYIFVHRMLLEHFAQMEL
ncbi:MAG: NACHT domain-containing protein, partial [Chloroflexota bacterium]